MSTLIFNIFLITTLHSLEGAILNLRHLICYVTINILKALITSKRTDKPTYIWVKIINTTKQSNNLPVFCSQINTPFLYTYYPIVIYKKQTYLFSLFTYFNAISKNIILKNGNTSITHNFF